MRWIVRLGYETPTGEDRTAEYEVERDTAEEAEAACAANIRQHKRMGREIVGVEIDPDE